MRGEQRSNVIPAGEPNLVLERTSQRGGRSLSGDAKIGMGNLFWNDRGTPQPVTNYCKHFGDNFRRVLKKINIICTEDLIENTDE